MEFNNFLGDILLRFDLQQSLRNSSINPKDLSSLQRILLTTDGTVTDILEAYSLEQMIVIKLFQDYVISEHDIPSLEIKKGRQILHRKILLHGRLSKKNYIYAESIIVPDRLDEKIKDGLLKSNKPIGLLILEDRLETFREILDCGREKAQDLAVHFDMGKNNFLIFRSYRVLANRLPIMLITEKFPENGIGI